MGAQFSSEIKDQWDIYTSNLKAPQCFLDMSFYFMIGAALQRRVWLGPVTMPICGNLYVVLCGPPGVGKGLSITPVTQLLKHHKYKGANITEEQKIEKMISEAQKTGAPVEVLTLLRQSKQALEQIKQLTPNKNKLSGDEFLFPFGSDATTFESLVRQHAGAIRAFDTKPCDMAPNGLYTYHSINVCIEEASSLFRKHSEGIIQYLLAAYNCQSYEYRTKNQGTDHIARSSLALLGGTTPEFMKDAFTDKLLGEGFTSRTFFVYADKNRFEDWKITALTDDQIKAREVLIARLKELSLLFGQCTMSVDAIQFMDIYFKEIHPIKRSFVDKRIRYYFARKDLHVQKLAMCLWFADNDSYEIPSPPFAKAVDMLDEIEKKMHFCLNTKAVNPLADLQKDIFRMLNESGDKSFQDIISQFFDAGDEDQINKALNYLVTTGQVVKDGLKFSPNKKK